MTTSKWLQLKHRKLIRSEIVGNSFTTTDGDITQQTDIYQHGLNLPGEKIIIEVIEKTATGELIHHSSFLPNPREIDNNQIEINIGKPPAAYAPSSLSIIFYPKISS